MDVGARAPESPSPASRHSSIVNVPGESTLRRDFLRLQQENKERSEALRRQQLLQEQQLREQEEYKRQLLAERQKRIEQQKEQRRRLEEVRGTVFQARPPSSPRAARCSPRWATPGAPVPSGRTARARGPRDVLPWRGLQGPALPRYSPSSCRSWLASPWVCGGRVHCGLSRLAQP